jgi:hypothetical protein
MQDEPTREIRFGLYRSGEDEQGVETKTTVRVDLSVCTNDTKESVLETVNAAHRQMVAFVNDNYAS